MNVFVARKPIPTNIFFFVENELLRTIGPADKRVVKNTNIEKRNYANIRDASASINIEFILPNNELWHGVRISFVSKLGDS